MGNGDFSGGDQGKSTSHVCVQQVPGKLALGCGSISPCLPWPFALSTQLSSSSSSSSFISFSSSSFLFSSSSFLLHVAEKPLSSAENMRGAQRLGWKLPFNPLMWASQRLFLLKEILMPQLQRYFARVFAIPFKMLANAKKG